MFQTDVFFPSPPSSKCRLCSPAKGGSEEDLEEEEYGKHRCCSGDISYEEQLLLMILNGLSHVVTSEPI